MTSSRQLRNISWQYAILLPPLLIWVKWQWANGVATCQNVLILLQFINRRLRRGSGVSPPPSVYNRVPLDSSSSLPTISHKWEGPSQRWLLRAQCKPTGIYLSIHPNTGPSEEAAPITAVNYAYTTTSHLRKTSALSKCPCFWDGINALKQPSCQGFKAHFCLFTL